MPKTSAFGVEVEIPSTNTLVSQMVNTLRDALQMACLNTVLDGSLFWRKSATVGELLTYSSYPSLTLAITGLWSEAGNPAYIPWLVVENGRLLIMWSMCFVYTGRFLIEQHVEM